MAAALVAVVTNYLPAEAREVRELVEAGGIPATPADVIRPRGPWKKSSSAKKCGTSDGKRPTQSPR